MIRLKIEIPIAVLGIDEIILFLYVFEYFFVIVSNSLMRIKLRAIQLKFPLINPSVRSLQSERKWKEF